MCMIVTQIMEVEAKIAQAQDSGAPEAEINVLRHELTHLNEQFEKQSQLKELTISEMYEFTDRQLNVHYLLCNGHSTQEEIDAMTDSELDDLVDHLINEGVY
jgi:hypothetical protein